MIDPECRDFLRGVAHDLRGPLNQLRTFSTLLCKQHQSSLAEDGQTLCTYIDQAAKRAAVVADAIDTFGRFMRTPEFEQTDLNSAMDTALSEIGLDPADSISRTDLGHVEGDRSMLTRLFRDLLTNCLKFRGNEPLKISVSAELHDNEKSIAVSDNGIGIPAGHADTVFQPLKRLNGFRYEGAGIGLTLCRSIVHKHGGRIWIEPAQTGTTVRFTLLRVHEREAAAPTDQNAPGCP